MKNRNERQDAQRDHPWRLQRLDAPQHEDEERDDVQRCRSEHDTYEPGYRRGERS
jgi:hypothetical protein